MKIRYYFLIIFILVIPCCANAAIASLPALLGHIGIIKELKERFAHQTKKIVQKAKINKSDQTTPSQSHIAAVNSGILASPWYSNQSYQQLLAENVNKYKPIVDLALEREKQYADTYYVFYHGQQNSFYVIQDFLKEIFALLALNAPHKKFEFLRPWYEAEKEFRVNQFIDRWEQGATGNAAWNDHESDLVKNMLCVNLSLFGNITNGGESSFEYFRDNRNINPPTIENMLKNIFGTFNFDSAYIKELLDLNTFIYANEGTLLQIFVPKSKVDDYVYLSHSFGTPYRRRIDDESYDAQRSRHLKISPILERYIKNAADINDFDTLQARVLLSQDGILNPNSGVKIFKYTIISDEKMQEYKQRLQKVVNAILHDWFARKLFAATILDNKFLAQLPLGIFLRNALR